MQFAPLIIAARRREGLTQDDLATLVGVGARAVWQIEQGGGTLKTLLPILRALRIAITGLPPAADMRERVTAARKKRGWSLQELSSRCGLSVPTIRALETGRGRVTSLETAILALAPTAHERRSQRPALLKDDGVRASASVPSNVASLIQGNCLEVMPTLPESLVTLAVVSPPYKAQKAYEGELSVEEYEEFADAWVRCLPRLLTATGAVWLNVGFTVLPSGEALPLTYLYHPVFRRHGFKLVQEVVWHYEGGLAYARRFSARTERWQWWVRDLERYTFNLDEVRDGTLNRTVDDRNSAFGKNPTDYWYFDRVVGGRGATAEKTSHPCQFPMPMIERIIRACSRPGELVLDCFGGSGTAALAAARNRRGFVSIERDPEYHRIAENRLERAGYQPVNCGVASGTSVAVGAPA